MRFLSWRAIFLIAFVIAMPILALPPVARRVDNLLYGAPPKDFGQPPSPPPAVMQAPTTDPPRQTGGLAPALFDETSPAVAAAQPAAYVTSESPPLLAPTPQFEPLAPPPAHQPASTPIDDQAIARLQQIRERLERLGADYVVVEVQDGGRYRFHCRMLVDDRSRFTKPFESSASDPVAAGMEVLRQVEAWRAGPPDQPRRLPQ
jgi:hypothetical protein